MSTVAEILAAMKALDAGQRKGLRDQIAKLAVSGSISDPELVEGTTDPLERWIGAFPGLLVPDRADRHDFYLAAETMNPHDDASGPRHD